MSETSISLTRLQNNRPATVQGQHDRAALFGPLLATIAAAILVSALIAESRLTPLQRQISLENLQVGP